MKEDESIHSGGPFDAAMYGRALDGDVGLAWEDPRELHRVVVTFASEPPDELQLQYWRSRWPQQRLPKDGKQGGGAAGWWELGNWFTGEWQTADAEIVRQGSCAEVTFRPVSQAEFPDLADFDAAFRTTLKMRLTGSVQAADVVSIEAYTDSTWAEMAVTVVWERKPENEPRFEAFNGRVTSARRLGDSGYLVTMWRTCNPDPNTFDRTLLTIRGAETVTVLVDDVGSGPVCVPDCGVCVVAGEDERDYAAVLSAVAVSSQPGIREMVAQLPEQTWSRAWANMVPKRERLYLPLGADGGRHRFALHPDGSLRYRTNNRYLLGCPGRDTDRLATDSEQMRLRFGLPEKPCEQAIAEGTLPIGMATWEADGTRIEQVAFATVLGGTDAQGEAPPADACGVCMVRFRFSNDGGQSTDVCLPMRLSAQDEAETLRVDAVGQIWAGEKLRAQVDTGGKGALGDADGEVAYRLGLEPGDAHSIVMKIPYVWLTGEEAVQLAALDFDVERKAVSAYWRRVLDQGMELSTPEPDLNDFHRAVAGHILINCELEPDSDRRFARCGSFGYGVFANEGCMMVVDLDRRGYHRQARECLEALLHYQGTVPLPGDFSSHEGVLYGAHGYEAVGYNQHHGWTLWCLVEHYRFTRDAEWLARIAGNIVAAADWIIGERSRTVATADIGRGLLPFGALEDISDWWQWLSTNVYTWRGLEAAAWALEQIGHEEAHRLRQQAEEYRGSILTAFTAAAERSPVVRLRKGHYVPHFPSHPHRRGRYFGWICETLEGAIHLLISGLLAADSREAQWILDDYEDNLYNSDEYGYRLDDYARHWFDRGGFSMQACLLFGVEPYLYRDDIKHALRAMFNATAANFFPDTRMLAEHALPELGDWRGDHYKSSDEANVAGWLRYLYVREDGDCLLVGQGVPRDWLRAGKRTGVRNAATHFGPMSVVYEAGEEEIAAELDGPRRNPPACIRLRLRAPADREISEICVDGEAWADYDGEWVILPGDIGKATVTAKLRVRPV